MRAAGAPGQYQCERCAKNDLARLRGEAARLQGVLDQIRERFERMVPISDSLSGAIDAAYRGSASHGSFFIQPITRTNAEYVPSPHMKLHELDHEIAEGLRALRAALPATEEPK